MKLARERRDHHRSPRLRTKVRGTNLTSSPFTAPAHNFEAANFAKTRFRKKLDSEPCVLRVKVGRALLRLTRERRDHHRSPRLRTKVRGRSSATVTNVPLTLKQYRQDPYSQELFGE